MVSGLNLDFWLKYQQLYHFSAPKLTRSKAPSPQQLTITSASSASSSRLSSFLWQCNQYFFNRDFCFTSFQQELLSPSTSCTSRAKQGLAETNFFWRYPGQWSYIYFQSIREVGVAVKTIFPKTKSLKVGLQWEFHSKGFWNIGCKKVLFAVGLYWWGAVFDGWKLCPWFREVVDETYGLLKWWWMIEMVIHQAPTFVNCL